MGRRNWGWAASILLVGIGLVIYYLLPMGAQKMEREANLHESQRLTEPHPAAPPTSPAHPSPQPSLPPLPVPDLKQVREEVNKNPHQTPISLIHFSDVLGARLESIEKTRNISEAQLLFKELEVCTLSTDPVPIPARALCLDSALQIGNWVPALQSRAKELKQSSKSEVTELLQQLKKISGKPTSH